MNKPRFPLSVRREFLYRAVIDDTGEIIEAGTFKTLFRVVRSRLRDAVYPIDGTFACVGASFEFGFHTSYEISRGYSYGEWRHLIGFGYMYVSTLSEVYIRYEDDKHCFMRGSGVV